MLRQPTQASPEMGRSGNARRHTPTAACQRRRLKQPANSAPFVTAAAATALFVAAALAGPGQRLPSPRNPRHAQGSPPPGDAHPPTERDPNAGRRACLQQALREAAAYDLNPEYFLIGCNLEPVWGWDAWAERTGCGGKEPLEEPLVVHTAWTGPLDGTLTGKGSVRRDIEALVDSFLVSQDTKRAKLVVWWMDRDPDPSDPLEARYASAVADGAVSFRRPDIAGMARGTPLEGRLDIVGMGANLSVAKRNKLPRQLANMFRTLALHAMGGVWVDTDTVLLRDLRPIFEYAGEFATQLSMSKYFNNNFMGLRRGSALGRHMLTTIAETGLPNTVGANAKYCKYVTRFGGDCYDVWYWNHGSIQLAVREKIGIVVLPTPFSDPGYQGCYAPYLMGWHGGLQMRGLDVGQLLELIRGSALIHTRAYNAKKPMHPESNFHRVYELARAGAERRVAAAIPVNPHGIGHRNATAERVWREAWAARKKLSPGVNRPNLIEPPWFPPKPRLCVFVRAAQPPPPPPLSTPSSSLAGGRCVGWARETDRDLGGNPRLVSGLQCARTRTAWAWHPTVQGALGGYLRPWVLRPKRLLCVDGDPSVYGRRAPAAVSVATAVCDPTRAAQRWVHVRGRILNMATRLCLAVGAGGTVVTERCGSSDAQRFELAPAQEVTTEWGTL